MILGVTILRKKYPLAKYLCVLLIVGGVALFLYKPNNSSAVTDDHIFGFGEILLVSPTFPSYLTDRYVSLELQVAVTSVTFYSRVVGLTPVAVSVSDVGRPDGCVPGPHEGPLPDERQPHDAQHQRVVHSDSGPG